VDEGRRATDRERMGERVAVVEELARRSERELERTREKVHELVAERSAIARLADAIAHHADELARVRAELRGEFEAMAAAAVTAALAEWEHERREEGDYRRGRVALGLQGVAVAVAAAGATAGIIFGLGR
jgi:hypothetical protein